MYYDYTPEPLPEKKIERKEKNFYKLIQQDKFIDKIIVDKFGERPVYMITFKDGYQFRCSGRVADNVFSRYPELLRCKEK